MGLDQYAYVATKAGARDQHYLEEDLPENQKTASKPREIAYWRKHPNLQGWMKQLWIEKGCPGWIRRTKDPMFNGIELELTWEDLDQLEQDVTEGNLPKTSGFFFGDDSDEYYKAEDLKFIKQARAELFCGLRVFYNSSW